MTPIRESKSSTQSTLSRDLRTIPQEQHPQTLQLSQNSTPPLYDKKKDWAIESQASSGGNALIHMLPYLTLEELLVARTISRSLLHAVHSKHLTMYNQGVVFIHAPENGYESCNISSLMSIPQKKDESQAMSPEHQVSEKGKASMIPKKIVNRHKPPRFCSRLFIGQLRRQCTTPSVLWALAMLCPEVSITHIDNRTNRDTGREKGCCWIHVDANDESKLLNLNGRLLFDHNPHGTGMSQGEGLWRVPKNPEQMRDLEEYALRRSDRNLIFPRRPIVIEKANCNFRDIKNETHTIATPSLPPYTPQRYANAATLHLPRRPPFPDFVPPLIYPSMSPHYIYPQDWSMPPPPVAWFPSTEGNMSHIDCSCAEYQTSGFASNNAFPIPRLSSQDMARWSAHDEAPAHTFYDSDKPNDVIRFFPDSESVNRGFSHLCPSTQGTFTFEDPRIFYPGVHDGHFPPGVPFESEPAFSDISSTLADSNADN